jgi:lipopolysaccharide cholinephosphotransferase
MKLSVQLSKELKERYNPEGSVLRKSQMRMLDMLVFIDKVCQENNLIYWIEGGTLLGAVRHDGFIPWDDDADLCMPYKDAEIFKTMAHPDFSVADLHRPA